MEENVEKIDVSLISLFMVMVKIGTFTIGGGYAMLLMIQQEVTGRGWISDDEFPDLITLSQAAPGLLAVNIAIFTGYRIRGTIGSVVATIGCCISPFLIILLIAIFFRNFADNPVVERVFKGMRPAVVALIAVPMVKMAISTCKVWWQWIVTAVSLFVIAFLDVSPVLTMITAIIVGVVISVAEGGRK